MCSGCRETRVCKLDGTGCRDPEYYISISQLSIMSSRCPSVSNLVNSSTVALKHLFSSGCGTSGALNVATAWTGSRCEQTCSAGTSRIRGGMVTAPMECRVGEWVSLSSQTATGAAVCGFTCPAITAPALIEPNKCSHLVAAIDFSNGTQSMADWYPTYKSEWIVWVPLLSSPLLSSPSSCPAFHHRTHSNWHQLNTNMLPLCSLQGAISCCYPLDQHGVSGTNNERRTHINGSKHAMGTE
jgi:hypothetical protein